MRARIALTASRRPLTGGDPGNAPDDAINCYAADCGSVPYPYSISRYEVTNAQYQEFLSATAADADALSLYNEGYAQAIADTFDDVTLRMAQVQLARFERGGVLLRQLKGRTRLFT